MWREKMGQKIETFNQFRSAINEKLLSANNLGIKRFFNLDTQAYAAGVLPVKTKELLGLVASCVLRCDDCITYHLIQCAKHHVSKEEFLEAFNIVLIVGGSITIPHLRRAFETLEELESDGALRNPTNTSESAMI
jgi:AhpD family alkylhydroperoxidase